MTDHVISTERSEWRDLLMRLSKTYYVYILRNISGTLYIGITSDLIKRVWQHKQKLVEGFTKKYNISILIYFEEYNDALIAIEREKQLKRWNRSKKLKLIKKINPSLKELIT